MKDLKVGMKVWIRKDLKGGTDYDGLYFHPEMEQLAKLNKPFEVMKVGKEDVAIRQNRRKKWFLNNAMIDWEKTIEENGVIRKSNLIYDGTTLEGQINGKEIKVTRSDKDKEDLEKAVMMALLKSLGVTYVDVKDLKNKVKKVWRPKYREKYYYIMSNLEVNCGYNDDYSMDKRRIQVGNCFETEEEAEKKVVEIRRILKK